MATVKTPSEQRVVLHNIGWATYERLLADNENNSTPRFAYDRGELEIMSPSPEHLERGFEPDSCFYIQNEEEVCGKDRMDPAVDPPPDLVIEIDITDPSLNKLPIYAQMGVP